METMKKHLFIFFVLTLFLLIWTGCGRAPIQTEFTITQLESLPESSFQGDVSFPDWKGYVDDTLAMNSLYSFDGAESQGVMYLTVDEKVESFDLFFNNKKIVTDQLKNGIYEIDFSADAINGINTVQVTNIVPEDLERAVRICIPYPIVISGTLAEAGIDEAPLNMISDIIESDIKYGFPSAQLAIIKDGKLVYQNAWGPVTNDTLYDLASNTKMYSAAYAVQYLVDRGELSLDDKIVDLIGKEFIDQTLEIKFSSFEDAYPGLKTIKEWKSRITVKDIMMHQAGFPDSGHYHNQKFDAAGQSLSKDVDNILYVANANKEKTLKEGICRTPLMYEPGTKTQYSDIDYMLLGLIIEKISGQDLNTFLSETFWKPMGLTHITYCPLEHGFTKEDCAATELNGNTRDGLIDFPGVRTETIQGEVHDEECYYTMEGVSGHAGLFANASDLAKLASVMLTGGYGDHSFFSKNTRDLFISPQTGGLPSYGIGWWREGDDRRVYYFGSQSPESTIGHQGWTGTLTMIDFENKMVVVLLTNSISTPIYNAASIEHANDFCGRYYTTATLGFVPQILYTGLSGNNPRESLDSLIKDMINEKQKLVDAESDAQGEQLPDDHPLMRALTALTEASSKKH